MVVAYDDGEGAGADRLSNLSAGSVCSSNSTHHCLETLSVALQATLRRSQDGAILSCSGSAGFK